MVKQQELYEKLKADGFSDLPDYEKFQSALQDKGKREQLHAALLRHYDDIPDFNRFDNALGSRDMTFGENVQHIGNKIGNTMQAAGKAFAEGGDRTAEGLFGAVGTVLPGGDPFERMAEASKAERAAQATLPSGAQTYRPVNTFESAGQKIMSGDVLGSIGEGVGATIETGAGSLAGMATAATPVVGVAAFGVSQMQQFAEERAKNSGRNKPDAMDYVVSVPAAAISAALERIGIGGLNSAPMRKYVTDSLQRRLGVNAVNTLAKTAIEGGTEAQQQIVQYAAETLGTQKDFDLGEAGRQALIAAAGGAGVGGMLGGPMSVMQKPETVRTDAGGREIAQAIDQQVNQADLQTQERLMGIGQPQPQVRQAPVPRESMAEKLEKRGVVVNGGARQFDQAVIQQESSGNPNAVNELSGATGQYQIMPTFLKEGNRLLGSNYSMQDMKDPAKAEQVKNAVHGLWIRQFQRRNGRLPDAEEMAMMHHGGPEGYLRPNAKDAHGISNAEYARQVVSRMGQTGGVPQSVQPEQQMRDEPSQAWMLPDMPQESKQQAREEITEPEPIIQSPPASDRLEADFVEPQPIANEQAAIQEQAQEAKPAEAAQKGLQAQPQGEIRAEVASPVATESLTAQKERVPDYGKTIEEKEPWQMTRAEFESKAMGTKAAGELISKRRSGDERSKHKGSVLTGFPDPKTPMVHIDMPISLLSDKEVQYVAEASDNDRVEKYAQQKIDTPITVIRSGKGGLMVSDGGHRLSAAIKRGDKTIPALITQNAHKDIIRQALAEGKPVPPEVLAEYPELKKKAPATEPAVPAKMTKTESLSRAQAAKREKALSQKVKYKGQSMTKAEYLQSLHDEGFTAQVDKIPDKKARQSDIDVVDRARAKGYVFTIDSALSNENLPEVKAGMAALKRLAADDYSKPEYRASRGTGFYPISKTEYDYMTSLSKGGEGSATLDQPPTKQQVPGSKPEPTTVSGKIEQQLEDAGKYTKEQRKAAGSFVQAFYDAKGKQLGVSPESLYKVHPYRIEGGDVRGDVLEQKTGELPATIEIDGKQRPTTNSEGRQIHPTEEGVRNFWKWFSDSKVVDEEGRPVVMYHGSPFDRFGNRPDFEEFEEGGINPREPVSSKGFYFSPTEYAAKQYGDEVYEVYLKSENPLQITTPDQTAEAIRAAQDEIEDAGIDSDKIDNIIDLINNPSDEFTDKGIIQTAYDIAEEFPAIIRNVIAEKAEYEGYDSMNILDSDRGDAYISTVVFSPDQIKSATGNSGAFSPADASILRQLSGKWYYSALQRAFESAKQSSMPGYQWAQWLASNANKLGVKSDEIRWSGLGDWLVLRGKKKVARQEIVDYLRQNGVQVQDVMKGEESDEYREKVKSIERLRDTGGTISHREAERRIQAAKEEFGVKYKDYIEKGGKNYRELLLTLPEYGRKIEPQGDGLFRVVDIDGHVVASNLGKTAAKQAMIKAKPLFTSSHWDEPNVLAHIRFNDRTDADGNKVLFVEEVQSDWGQEGRTDGFDNNTPSAPFVTDTKAWVSLALKRMIRYAAENGYDKIAFVNGEQSAERYDLSKQVDGIQIQPSSNPDKVHVFVKQKGAKEYQRIGDSSSVEKAKLPDVLGKELAQKALADIERDPDGVHEYEGLDLKVGGEGMKAFYDKIVPQVAGSIVKKYGATLASANVGTDTEQLSFDVTPQMREAAMSGMPLFQKGEGETLAGFDPARLTTILTEKATFASFLHETGHAYLDMTAAMASQKGAPKQINFDMDILLKWFGVKDLAEWNAMNLNRKRKYHEQFAYNFEVYLSEGKAPNAGLKGVFDRFKQWLKEVYHDIKTQVNAAYRAETGEDLPGLTDEVRGVMDRMLADKPYVSKEGAAFRKGNAVPMIAGGKPFADAQYVLIERGDIVASHDPETFRENQKYPQERQNRDYSNLNVRSKAEDAIEGIAKNEFLTLLQPSVESDAGMPTVNKYGIVLSGNNRTFSILRKYESYRKALNAVNMSQFGLSPADIAAMKGPVLVRLMNDPEAEADFVIASNEQKVKTLTTAEIRKHYWALPTEKKDAARRAVSGVYREFNKADVAKIDTFLSNLQLSDLPSGVLRNLKESSALADSDMQDNAFTSTGIDKVKMLALTLLNEDMQVNESALDFLTDRKEGNGNLDRKFDAAIGDLFLLRSEMPEILEKEMADLGAALMRRISVLTTPAPYQAQSKELSAQKAIRGATVEDDPLNVNASTYYRALASDTIGSLKKIVSDKISRQEDMFASAFAEDAKLGKPGASTYAGEGELKKKTFKEHAGLKGRETVIEKESGERPRYKTPYYEVITNAQTVEEAVELSIDRTIDEIEAAIRDRSVLIAPHVRVALAELTLKRLSEQYRKTRDAGILERQNDLADWITDYAEETGRTLQAFSLYKSLTPEGVLVAYNRAKRKAEKAHYEKNQPDVDDVIGAVGKGDKEQKSRKLKDLLRQRNRVARKIRPLFERIVEASELGAFGKQEFYDIVGPKLGLPEYSEDVARRLMELAEAVQLAPEGIPQEKAIAELHRFMAKHVGFGVQDLPLGIFYGNILSGYMTHAVNIADTFANVVSEVNNLAISNPKAAAFVYAQFIRGFNEGRYDAVLAWSEGRRLSDGKWYEGARFMDIAEFGKPGGVPIIKKSALSRYVKVLTESKAATPLNMWKYVTRLLTAEDALMWRPSHEARAALLAFKLAEEQGLKGSSLIDRASSILNLRDITPYVDQAKREGFAGQEAMARAVELRDMLRPAILNEDAKEWAGEATYNHTPRGLLGLVAKQAQILTNKIPPLKFLVPFTQIVANVTNRGLNWTPYGFKRAYYGHFFGDPLNAEQRQAMLVRATVGTSALVGVAALNALGAIVLHGHGPEDDKKRYQMMNGGWIPYSVEIDGKYISYANTPIGLGLAALGNAIDMQRYGTGDDESTGNRLAMAVLMIGNTVFSQSFLSGLSGFFEALTNDNSGQAMAAWKSLVSRTVSGLSTPNALRDTYRFFDPKAYRASSFMEAIVKNTPFAASAGLKPALNSLGQPIYPLGAGATAAQRNRFFGVKSGNTVWRYVMDSGIRISVPSATTEIDLQNDIRMTPDQYYEYHKEQGQDLYRYIERNLSRLKKMEKEDAEEVVNNYGKQNRKRILSRMRRKFNRSRQR